MLYLALFKPLAWWFGVSLGMGVDLNSTYDSILAFSVRAEVLVQECSWLLIDFPCILPLGILTRPLNLLWLVKLHSHFTECSNNCPDLLLDIALDEAQWRAQNLCPCWRQGSRTFHHGSYSSSQGPVHLPCFGLTSCHYHVFAFHRLYYFSQSCYSFCFSHILIILFPLHFVLHLQFPI